MALGDGVAQRPQDDSIHVQQDDSIHVQQDDSVHVQQDDSIHVQQDDSIQLQQDDSVHVQQDDSIHVQQDDHANNVGLIQNGGLKPEIPAGKDKSMLKGGWRLSFNAKLIINPLPEGMHLNISIDYNFDTQVVPLHCLFF